jgi:hypothetical protein
MQGRLLFVKVSISHTHFKEIPAVEKELICGDKGYGAMASLPMITSIVYAAVRDKFAVRSHS